MVFGEEDEFVSIRFDPERSAELLPVGQQFVERAGLDAGTGKDVRPDLGALFDDADGNLALLFGGGKDWVADITGFGAGFGLAFLVSPGGWAAVKRRVRRQ